MTSKVDSEIIFRPLPPLANDAKKRSRDPHLPQVILGSSKDRDSTSMPLQKKVKCTPASIPYDKKEIEGLKDKIEKSSDSKIGDYVSEQVFDSLFDEIAIPRFEKGEAVLVIRTGPGFDRYQFAMVIGEKDNHILFLTADGHAIMKMRNFIYKIKPPKLDNEPLVPSQEQDYDQAKAKTLNYDFIPTQVQPGFVASLTCYRGGEETLDIAGIRYDSIHCGIKDFSSRPIAMCGGTSVREIIVIDPEDSVLLNAYFDDLLFKVKHLQKEIGLPLTTQQVLNVTMKYIRENVFTSYEEAKIKHITNHESKTSVYSREALDHPIRVVSIERTLLAHTGSSRHHAITACYILHKLTRESFDEPILDGIVQYHRFNMAGSHGYNCVTFIPKHSEHEIPQRWFFDSFQGELRNFSFYSEQVALKKYGEAAVSKIIGNTNDAADNCGQAAIEEEVQPWQEMEDV